MRRVVILQSAYIPWKGYFHLARCADLFIFHDDLQYTYQDWRTRNQIITPAGPTWLTIPAGKNIDRLICEVEVEDQGWKKKHRRQLSQYYGKAPFFRHYQDLLDFLYDNDVTNLAEFNQRAIRHLASMLGIETEFSDSRAYKPSGSKTERLIDILTKAKATQYISGPAAKAYIDPALFDQAGIELTYFEYPAYREYPQIYQPFCHEVSILDLMFHVGTDAPRYIWDA